IPSVRRMMPRAVEAIHAYRTDAHAKTHSGKRVSQALIGKNPPPEKIERRDAGNPHDSAERCRKEARNFKNLTHYIPPAWYVVYKLLVVIFCSSPCADHAPTGGMATGHFSRRSLFATSTELSQLPCGGYSLSSFRGECTFHARGQGQGLAKPKTYPAIPD